MKRTFLFGLGSFLILCVVFGLRVLWLQQDIPNAILVLVLMLVSVIVILAARRAPPHHSRLHAVFGWLLGFLVVGALALVGISIVVQMPGFKHLPM